MTSKHMNLTTFPFLRMTLRPLRKMMTSKEDEDGLPCNDSGWRIGHSTK